VAGARVVLFCAWLAWSGYRVVVPVRNTGAGSPSATRRSSRSLSITG
jgi:hypothetical protein